MDTNSGKIWTKWIQKVPKGPKGTKKGPKGTKRLSIFTKKKPGFTEKWKNGFCHFWPSEAFAAFVSLLDEFVRMRWLYSVSKQRPQRFLKARKSK